MSLIPVPAAMQAATRGFYPKVINGSLRFNDDDSAYLSWTPASAGNRKTWTWSAWVKRGNLGSRQFIFTTGDTGTNGFYFEFDANDSLNFGDYSSGFIWQKTTSAVYRDVSAWYHIVLRYDTTEVTPSDRIKLYVNGSQVTAFGTNTNPTSNYDGYINGTTYPHALGRFGQLNSLYTDGYLAEVHFIDGQALTADDFGELKNGVWVAKDYAGTFGTNGFYLTFEDDTQVEAFNTVLYRGNGGTVTQEFGFDPDLVWYKNRSRANTYHYLFDTVRGADRALYSNLTSSEDSQFPTFNQQLFVPNGSQIVRTVGDHLNYDGDTYVAWAWDAGANNAVTGHSSVTYTGNNGTQIIKGLPFSPDLIWAKNRVDAGYHHDLYDTVRGDNLRLYSSQTSAEGTGYLEFLPDGFKLTSGGGINNSGSAHIAWAWDAGDSDPASNTDGSITSTVKASQANGFSIITYTGNGTAGATIGHGLSQAPDLIFTKKRDGVSDWLVYNSTNGANYGLRLNTTDSLITSSTYWNNTEPTTSVFSVGTSGAMNTSGADYIAYCWHDVTGKQKFGTYTGDGTTDGSKTITTGFRPGFLMIKKTSSAGGNWVILDGSRDPINNIGSQLYADTSDAEAVESGGRVEFTSTGFKLVSSGGSVNGNGETYIYAAFAGSYSDYITDYNTDGSIDSRVKASDTTGFSICSFTTLSSGSFNFGHGLSSAPDFILAKSRTGAYNWPVYHSSVGAGNYLLLNSTAVSAASTTVWGNTTPSSSVVYSDAAGLVGNQDYIAYCWTATTGVSAFGSYTANNSTNGPEVDCGFKPAFVMVKHTTKAEQWIIFDATRETTNDRSARLFPALSNAESSIPNDQGIRFLSTAEGDSISGFKITVAGGYGINDNDSGSTYIYAAFADTREAAFWLDQSGNDNDWQPNNLDHNDTVADSPTDNFATLNPLSAKTITLSDGNLQGFGGSGGSGDVFAESTIAVSSGQYYCEVTYVAQGTNNALNVGIKDVSTNQNYPDYGYYGFNGNKYNDLTGSAYGDSYTVGDTIGIALDLDAGTLTFYKNGTSQGTAFTGLSGTFTFCQARFGGDSHTTLWNFGQQPFKYDPPA